MVGENKMEEETRTIEERLEETETLLDALIEILIKKEILTEDEIETAHDNQYEEQEETN